MILNKFFLNFYVVIYSKLISYEFKIKLKILKIKLIYFSFSFYIISLFYYSKIFINFI